MKTPVHIYIDYLRTLTLADVLLLIALIAMGWELIHYLTTGYFWLHGPLLIGGSIAWFLITVSYGIHLGGKFMLHRLARRV